MDYGPGLCPSSQPVLNKICFNRITEELVFLLEILEFKHNSLFPRIQVV